MEKIKLFLYKHNELIEKTLWGVFPTIYLKILHDNLVTWINSNAMNILINNPALKLFFTVLMTILCFVSAYLLVKLLRCLCLPSPNYLSHQPVYNKFLTKLKDELGAMTGINRNQVKNFRFSIYREFRDYPKKGQTLLYCCARINDQNAETKAPRTWKMKNNSNGKNAGIIGSSLARSENVHLVSELKSFDSLKNMLKRGESLKYYSETLNINEKDLVRDLKSNCSESIGVHRYPEELICIPFTNVTAGKRLVLVLDCGISVSGKKRKNNTFINKIESSFLNFEQDVLKEIESLHYVYKLKDLKDYFLKGAFSKI
jgi:hypothetical protein